jgi:hypothetical protein
MSNIPLFSRRAVPFMGRQTSSDAPVLEFFDAQYAESAETVLRFCQNYGVSYLAVNKNDFTPAHLAEQDFFYQPWNDKIIETIAGRTDFILLQLEPIFVSDPFVVIECDAETIF